MFILSKIKNQTQTKTSRNPIKSTIACSPFFRSINPLWILDTQREKSMPDDIFMCSKETFSDHFCRITLCREQYMN